MVGLFRNVWQREKVRSVTVPVASDLQAPQINKPECIAEAWKNFLWSLFGHAARAKKIFLFSFFFHYCISIQKWISKYGISLELMHRRLIIEMFQVLTCWGVENCRDTLSSRFQQQPTQFIMHEHSTWWGFSQMLICLDLLKKPCRALSPSPS